MLTSLRRGAPGEPVNHAGQRPNAIQELGTSHRSLPQPPGSTHQRSRVEEAPDQSTPLHTGQNTLGILAPEIVTNEH